MIGLLAEGRIGSTATTQANISLQRAHVNEIVEHCYDCARSWSSSLAMSGLWQSERPSHTAVTKWEIEYRFKKSCRKTHVNVDASEIVEACTLDEAKAATKKYRQKCEPKVKAALYELIGTSSDEEFVILSLSGERLTVNDIYGKAIHGPLVNDAVSQFDIPVADRSRAPLQGLGLQKCEQDGVMCLKLKALPANKGNMSASGDPPCANGNGNRVRTSETEFKVRTDEILLIGMVAQGNPLRCKAMWGHSGHKRSEKASYPDRTTPHASGAHSSQIN